MTSLDSQESTLPLAKVTSIGHSDPANPLPAQCMIVAYTVGEQVGIFEYLKHQRGEKEIRKRLYFSFSLTRNN